MSPKQESLYWREWGAVHKADPSVDRHELHIAALGEDKSHKLFTNEDFDKVLGQMRAISKPTNLDAQLRQLNQQKTRLLWKITVEQLTLLSVYGKTANYVLSVALDKFDGLRGFPSPGGEGQGEGGFSLRTELSKLAPKQLEHLRSTLADRINNLRRDKGHTIHEMLKLACLPCKCAICVPRRPQVVLVNSGTKEPLPF